MRVKKCIKCSEEFETDKMGNICKECKKKTANEWYYKNKAEGKLRYQRKQKVRVLPLQVDRNKELVLIKSELKKCNTREERRVFYAMMFDKIFNNKPLWEYIIRFGDDHVPNTNQKQYKKQLKENENGA
jgi:hypothetical protein